MGGARSACAVQAFITARQERVANCLEASPTSMNYTWWSDAILSVARLTLLALFCSAVSTSLSGEAAADYSCPDEPTGVRVASAKLLIVADRLKGKLHVELSGSG